MSEKNKEKVINQMEHEKEEGSQAQMLGKKLTIQLLAVKEKFAEDHIQTIDGLLLSEVIMESVKCLLIMTIVECVRPECIEKCVEDIKKDLIGKTKLLLEYHEKFSQLKKKVFEKEKLFGNDS